ncbi:hypothetical protein D9M72_433270 [compost metagenome]
MEFASCQNRPSGRLSLGTSHSCPEARSRICTPTRFFSRPAPAPPCPAWPRTTALQRPLPWGSRACLATTNLRTTTCSGRPGCQTAACGSACGPRTQPSKARRYGWRSPGSVRCAWRLAPMAGSRPSLRAAKGHATGSGLTTAPPCPTRPRAGRPTMCTGPASCPLPTRLAPLRGRAPTGAGARGMKPSSMRCTWACAAALPAPPGSCRGWRRWASPRSS